MHESRVIMRMQARARPRGLAPDELAVGSNLDQLEASRLSAQRAAAAAAVAASAVPAYGLQLSTAGKSAFGSGFTAQRGASDQLQDSLM